MSAPLNVEFYHRSKKRMAEPNVQTLVGASIEAEGLVVDRLKDVTAKRLNSSYWHYVVPVRSVAA